MKDYVNWAILAPGIIANSMAQAMKGSAAKDKRIRLYAVGSRNIQRSKEFAEKWGFEKAYGSYDDLLSDPEVDAVYIANPHAFHMESAMACIEKGKHVLCEKPAGCNLSQLNTMIDAAGAKNLFFMEAMWTAFNPCVKKIRQAVSEGSIGQLLHIESRFCNRIPYDTNSRFWAPEQAGGALLDLGLYNIYFSSIVNGFSPIAAKSSAVRMIKGVDAWESVNLTYENGVTASFQAAVDEPSLVTTHDAVVWGTEGFITVENFFCTQKAKVHRYKNAGGNESEVTEVLDVPFGINGYEYELVHATDCILSGKIESDVHTFQKSRDLCRTMDELRKEWNFTYPFE